MSAHPLDPLLKPRSVALVGASAKQNSPGRHLADMVINSSFSGEVFPVNPGYESIFNTPCYPDFASLPQKVDHAVLAVGNQKLEQALKDAVSHGVAAATIYSSCVLEDDADFSLKQRIAHMAGEAGIAVCGGNGMGFYNPVHELYAGIYPFPGSVRKGGISFIAQSGSAFSAFAHNGCRLRFNLCVSSGEELVTTAADYMDWSLHQRSTKVIGLFLETVRDPAGFAAALREAAKRRIPVVVLKLGKSPLAAAMAQTHTGAITGDHVVYEALFKKYGVVEVDNLNEMAATLMLFQSDRPPGRGEIGAILESGGFREMISDCAHRMGITFADITDATKDKIRPHLEPGLIAENPLDAWGSKENFEFHFGECLSALARDGNVAVVLFVTNFKDGYFLTEAFYRSIKKVHRETAKPIIMVNCYSDLTNSDMSSRTSDLGIPMIDGSREALLAVNHLLHYRDYHFSEDKKADIQTDPEVVLHWKTALEGRHGEILNEAESLRLLADFSIPVAGHVQVNSLNELERAVKTLAFPIALKTAAAGVSHKSDECGVVLDIDNEDELISSYKNLCSRLGPAALVSNMVKPGAEVGLGVINDDHFGPFVVVAAGGTLIEIVPEKSVSMAPVNRRQADELLSSLCIDKLIRGTRGRPAGNRDALIDIIVLLSQMACALKDHIKEIDVNPVIVNESNAVAVDGLTVLK